MKKNVYILISVLALVLPYISFANKFSSVDIKKSVVTSPYKLTQEVIVADVLHGSGKELVTFSVDEQSNRWLIIYQLDSNNYQYNIAEKSIIPQYFYRFDLSENSNKTLQSIYFISASSLAVYQNKQFKTLTRINSLYVQEQVDFLSRGDFIQDLNNDSFDDVIITGFDKTYILIGQGLNNFAKQTLPIKPSVRLFSNGATYTEATLFFSDVNLDNKTDILLIGDGEMMFYPQYGNSQFPQKASRISINEKISGTDWWKKRNESGDPIDQSNLAYRKLEQLRDINADGLTDMVVRFTKTAGVLDRVNDYEIFLGKQSNGLLSYDQAADSVIHADGTLTGFKFVDIDNDDKLEVLLAGFDIGLSQIIGALVTGGIDQDVYVFKMNGQDEFTTKPAIKKEVELTFSLSSGQTGSAVVKLADLNGDGLKDLVLSNDDDELKIYLGKKANKNKKHFNKRSVRYSTVLPKDGNQVMVEDLNADGKDDLLIQFSHLDGQEKVNNLSVLFSQ